MGRYEKNLLGIVMYFNENIKMNEKLRKNQGGVLTKLLANSPRVAHLVSYKNHYLGLHFVLGLEDYD